MFVQLTYVLLSMCRAFQPLTNVDPDPKFVNQIYFASLPPMPEHYLALLSSISFSVILSKCYLFFVLIYYIVN